MSKRISHEQLDQAIWLHLRDQDQHPFDSYQLRAMANYSMVKARIQAMRKVGRIRFLHFVARQHRPAHVTNPLTTLTLHTLTRWLTPWRTIRQLEAENRQLQHSNERLVSMVFLACSKNVARDRRLRRCRTHGQQPPTTTGNGGDSPKAGPCEVLLSG